MVERMYSTAIAKYQALFKTPRSTVEKEFSPYFYRYFSRFFGDPERFYGYIEKCKYLFKVTKAKDASVLDIGCGFGLMATLFGLFGAKEVIGYDLNTEKINVFQKLLHYLGPEIKNVKPVLGDSMRVVFEDESFDVVVMNETLSHVREMKKSLDEAHRVLKSGGCLLIRDGNNAFFLPGKIRRRRFWQKIERGPVDPSIFRSTDIPLPFIEVRQKMILERFPQLDRWKIEVLADKTAGMFGKEIFNAVEEFDRVGEVLTRPEWRYRNPVTGEFPERELNPVELKRLLMNRGFRVSFIPYFYSESFRDKEMMIKRFYYLMERYVPILHLFLTPGFALLGIK